MSTSRKPRKGTKEQAKSKPDMPWQTGEYERLAEFKVHLPYQFLLLCKLTEVTPRKVLVDFMDNMDHGSWDREGRDKAKEHLVAYFLEMGYGQNQYTPDDLRELFKEMDAIGLLFPKEADMDIIDMHARWRDVYHNYWFEKWWGKMRRKK